MSSGLKDALGPQIKTITMEEFWMDEDTVPSWNDTPIWKNEKACTCGAKHTSAPNLHMFYCDLYKDPMGN